MNSLKSKSKTIPKAFLQTAHTSKVKFSSAHERGVLLSLLFNAIYAGFGYGFFAFNSFFFLPWLVLVWVWVWVCMCMCGVIFLFHFTFMCECVLYSWFSHFQTFDSFGISLHFLLLHPFALALSFNVWFLGVNKTVYVWYIFASAPSHQVIGNSSTSISIGNNKKNHFRNSAYCTACSTKVTHTNGIPV